MSPISGINAVNGLVVSRGNQHPFLDLVAKALPLAESLLSHGTPGMQLAAMVEKVKPPAPAPPVPTA